MKGKQMSNMYNIMNGMNSDLCVIISIITGERIDQKFPRFRDIFTSDRDANVFTDYYVYTRMGGGNRDCWGSENNPCDCPACIADKIEQSEYCVSRYDDDYDSTYCTFCMNFSPDQKKEWENLKSGVFPDNWKERVMKLFPDKSKGGRW
jgi:hypothetical protein